MLEIKVNGETVNRILEHKPARGHASTDMWTVVTKDGKVRNLMTMSAKYGYADVFEEGVEVIKH